MSRQKKEPDVRQHDELTNTETKEGEPMNTSSLSQKEQIRQWRDALRAGKQAPWPLVLPDWVDDIQINAYQEEVLVDYFGKEHTSGDFHSHVNMCFVIYLDPASEEYDEVFEQAPGPRVEVWPDLNESVDAETAMCVAAVLRAAAIEIIKHKEEGK